MLTESVLYVEDVWNRLNATLVQAVAVTGFTRDMRRCLVRNGHTTSIAPHPVLSCLADILSMEEGSRRSSCFSFVLAR